LQNRLFPTLLIVLIAKETVGDSMRKSQSKILPRCQNSLFAHFSPAGILLGSAFPKPCLCGLRRWKIPQNNFSDFSKTVPLYTLFFSY